MYRQCRILESGIFNRTVDFECALHAEYVENYIYVVCSVHKENASVREFMWTCGVRYTKYENYEWENVSL